MHGEVEKQYFPAHTEFYRYTPLPMFGSGRSASPWRAGVVRGDGLAALLTRAVRSNVSPQDYLRARSAVTWEWNTLAHLVIVRLARPAYGLVGRCRHQQFSTEPQLANVAWIGGAWQVYLPNLRSRRRHPLRSSVKLGVTSRAVPIFAFGKNSTQLLPHRFDNRHGIALMRHNSSRRPTKSL